MQHQTLHVSKGMQQHMQCVKGHATTHAMCQRAGNNTSCMCQRACNNTCDVSNNNNRRKGMDQHMQDSVQGSLKNAMVHTGSNRHGTHVHVAHEYT